MRSVNLSRFVATFVLTIAASWAGDAFAQSARSDVQAALDSLNSWLDGSDHGAGWHQYLNTPELQQQLDQGDKADLDVVQRQIDLYAGSQYGLQKENFTAVRDALRAWQAELQLPADDELGEIASKAVENVRPVDQQKLEEAQQQLDNAGTQLENFLRAGDESKEAGWKNYLRWDDLTETLAEESPDHQTLVQIWALFASGTPGLEVRQFATYRKALQNYLELQEYFADESNALENLPQQLTAFQGEANEQTIADLGQTLGWLRRTQQGKDAIEAIDRHVSKPNFFINFSDQLVTHGFVQDVDQTNPINNYSNGASTQGNGHTVAKITAALIPDGTRGEVAVSMDGQVKSNTRTTASRGVSYNTNGTTSIDAEKSVIFASGGLQGEPATARCSTNSSTFNLQASSQQVRNVAQQRIAASRQQREYQMSRAAEQQVKTDLNRRVATQVQEANDRLEQDFFDPLMRRGVKPRMLKFSSTRENLRQRMTLAAPEQLAAFSDPPQVKQDGDVNVRLHTSWLENFADISLRGTLLTDEGLADALEEWRGEVPEELRITADSEPWDITLAARRPIRLELADNRLTFTLRGERFTARDRVQNEPMFISASYTIDSKDGKVKLVRDDEVQVSFPKQGDKLPTRLIATRNFWRTKFSALFEEEFTDLNLQLGGAWETAGPLTLTDIGTHADGWLSLAWVMPEEDPVAANGPVGVEKVGAAQ